MIMKDLLWNNKVKYTVIGTGVICAAMIFGKLLYDYSMYSNLKYVRKKLNSIKREVNWVI